MTSTKYQNESSVFFFLYLSRLKANGKYGYNYHLTLGVYLGIPEGEEVARGVELV